ncbi:MAG TPA: YdeI/OmpD-associated family protein [Candidatus Limnocylindrales bacterium]
MSTLDDAPFVHADDRETWRAWLEANHTTARGAWLVTWRPRSGRVGLDYDAAVEEALCFGWVDSTGGRFDDERGKLYFAPRKPRSAWAGSNKARVEFLIAEGRMAPAGLAAIERAKANGAWQVLDAAERLEMPEDLSAALDARAPAAVNFEAFPPSTRKMLLGWVALARRPETRAARIARIAEAAARNERSIG